MKKGAIIQNSTVNRFLPTGWQGEITSKQGNNTVKNYKPRQGWEPCQGYIFNPLS